MRGPNTHDVPLRSTPPAGNRKKNELKCSKCAYELEFDAAARAVKCTEPAGKSA
jgi:hypothetical protein